jgi:RNA polymerase primary sigma factor|tara:strand:+ start:22446 stop:23288 length:843 start_codon:yes stop_codon:yes gene_type:complete
MSKKFISSYDDNITRYFKEIRKSNTLSADEEVELAKRIQEGDEVAKAKLVKANLKFVISVAKDYQNQGLPLSDLISEGNEGLIKAAQKFDYKRGYKFISYAVWWIKQTIKQSLNDNSRMVRLPANVISKVYQEKKMKVRFENDNERPIEDGESYINKEGIEETFKEDMLPSCTSLSKKINDEGDELIELIGDESTFEDNDYIAVDDNLRKEINKVLDTLDPREADIITLYFGLNPDYSMMTLEEVGDKHSLTKERVRQIKEKALRKLRHNASELFNYLNQ